MAQVKELSKLTLKEMLEDFEKYYGLPEGLAKLSVPFVIKIGRKTMPVPQTAEAMMEHLCYGQRIFLAQKEENDFGIILRMIDGYYYPIYTKKDFDSTKSILFGKKVISCKAKDLYPVAMHLITLLGEITEREHKLLHREPSKMELAAGIEKLNVFAELTSLDFLRDAMKVTVPEVLLTPYKECLVRFMIAKETEAYKDRYIELLKEESKVKNKKHG